MVALLQGRPGGRRWAEIAAEVRAAGSAVAVWQWLMPPSVPGPAQEAYALDAAARQIAQWAGHGVRLLSILDQEYPARLRQIPQAPPILFARGEVIPDDLAVSVIGSRQASGPGLDIAARVAQGLARRGVAVAAGLALGIDSAAHRAALAAGGRTVAVVGTGINRAYPAGNRGLQEEIAQRGLVLSQFWPEAPARKHNFLMRNATMSGYGLATVVVEAGERGGARHQARVAAGHGRPVILTDLVARRCDWARALAGRPGVHVARGLVSVLDLIDQLIAGSLAPPGDLHPEASREPRPQPHDRGHFVFAADTNRPRS
jgi:DNA processing protein